MISKKLYAIVIILFLLFNACKKEDDTITSNVTVHGNVLNTCTGNGFANVVVQFLTVKNNTTSGSIATTTDAYGNFTFSGSEIHSSSKYSYELYIKNNDSYLSGEYGPSGIDVVIDKDKLSNFHQLGISASFKLCPMYLPSGVNIVSPDTFTITLEQRILHFYEPNRVYQAVLPSNIFPVNFGDYPMGLWHITFDKTKAGVHSIINDSIYLDMGATASYTIPW